MTALYIPVDTFVVVITPHFRQMFEARNGPDMTDDLHRQVWSILQPGEVSGFAWGNGYAYCRAQWNAIRNRWELEYISYTPANNFHTRNRNYARFIEVPCGA
jgi:hypothetical protein